jgi:hypothetical protein
LHILLLGHRSSNSSPITGCSSSCSITGCNSYSIVVAVVARSPIGG